MHHGLTADLIPSAYKAEELAEALVDKITAGDKILIARAKVAREVLPNLCVNSMQMLMLLRHTKLRGLISDIERRAFRSSP